MAPHWISGAPAFMRGWEKLRFHAKDFQDSKRNDITVLLKNNLVFMLYTWKHVFPSWSIAVSYLENWFSYLENCWFLLETLNLLPGTLIFLPWTLIFLSGTLIFLPWTLLSAVSYLEHCCKLTLVPCPKMFTKIHSWMIYRIPTWYPEGNVSEPVSQYVN